MLRRAASSSPWTTTIRIAPTSGRKVTMERIGQSVMSMLSRGEHDVGDQGSDADQHGKGVVVEVPGLQADDAIGHVDHPSRDAVRAETVDQPTVALLPQEASEPLRRADEEDVIELVEIPLVEQEPVEPVMTFGKLPRHLRSADVEVPSNHRADEHRDRGGLRYPERKVIHVLEHVANRVQRV